MTTLNSSYIENHEEDEAKKLINDYLGFAPPHVCGYYLGVVLYLPSENAIDAEGRETMIVRSDSSRALDKFSQVTGLVVYMGHLCYTDPKRFGTFNFETQRYEKIIPWCKIGDWITLPRHEGIPVNYRGRVMHLLPDDKCLMVVDDPKFVTRV